MHSENDLSPSLQLYKAKQSALREVEALHSRREICRSCRQPQFSCYCELVQPIETGIKFVILIHPIEVRRRIATGRMAHLCLRHSILISGENFSAIDNVNELIQNPENRCLVLYPGPQSLNLDQDLGGDKKASLLEGRKQLVIFVIDGTWATARKMVRLSQNIAALPRICFVPNRPSRFRVRKQPNKNCYSTIEAIHQTIDILQASNGRSHDHLLEVFDAMVEQQLSWISEAKSARKTATYRRVTERSDSDGLRHSAACDRHAE